MSNSGEVVQPPPPAGFDLPDQNHNVAIIAGTAATTALAILVVALRLYVRAFIVSSVGADDLWMFAALFLSLVGFAIVVPSVVYGAGRHLFYILTELGPEKLILALKLNLTTQIIYVFALTFAKFSVGLFLLRLTPSGWVRKLIWGMLALVGLWTVAGSSALMASCTPFAATFDRTIPNHRCYPPQTARALAYTNSCKNNSHSCHRCENAIVILTDAVFATLPMFLLRKLHINSKTKVAVISILSLGWFAASASIVKLKYLTRYGARGDFLWDSAYLTIWSVTEVNVGIIAGSIPALKPLCKNFFGSSQRKNILGRYPYVGRYPYAPRYERHSSSTKSKYFDSSNSSKGATFSIFAGTGQTLTAISSNGYVFAQEKEKTGLDVHPEDNVGLDANGDTPVEDDGIVLTMRVSVNSDSVESDK